MAITSYITEAAATTYLAEVKLNMTAWTNATVNTRNIALKKATQAINMLAYKGSKNDSAQANQFPRGDDTEVPDDIANATAELAFAYINGRDPELEFEDLTVQSKRLGPASETLTNPANRTHIAAGIISLDAWKLMVAYIKSPTHAILERV